MNHAVESYPGELMQLREKVEVYERLLHKLQLNVSVLMDHEVVTDLLQNICDWSYAHRTGNGEYTEEEQNATVKKAFDKLLQTREPWSVRNAKA
jgi:hypothetical protein